MPCPRDDANDIDPIVACEASPGIAPPHAACVTRQALLLCQVEVPVNAVMLALKADHIMVLQMHKR